MKGVSQLPVNSAKLYACVPICVCDCMWIHVWKLPCLMIMSVLPQALWVSTEVSELGEYFLLPSERSLSE